MSTSLSAELFRPSQSSGTPVCVDIPVNMSLCHGIGYTKMRLPNLLHHDSLQEVSRLADKVATRDSRACLFAFSRADDLMRPRPALSLHPLARHGE